jgi:predicted acylesterase/phospholipase RssA
MRKIGLALSGGGFRATLYHLGLVRFLRDASLLSQVSHITAVSGGSIIAAHLGLNWGRYTGSASEFDAAAAELIAFIRLDVRNRILRRYPLGLSVRWARRLLRRSNRKLTLPGLLEYHYERYLYGDTSLFQLPEHPRLHLLATNVSEGCLCSFNREGLWMIGRDGERGVRIERHPIGLATVPMAVAASSAFPGMFPPTELSGHDVGAKEGEFGTQAYTDGGVFDNLGVRMFRLLAMETNGQAAPAPAPAPWDGVLVSDVGKPFEVRGEGRVAGLIRTAMRASDILMDRVWQLENETFRDEPGFAFARITDFVGCQDDPTAPHPEIQRQLPGIRTDLNRFSTVEISNLIRQGYCVGRKTCRAHPELFGTNLPDNPPWDPVSESRGSTTAASSSLSPQNGGDSPTALHPRRAPTSVTREARTLHNSAVRGIWRTLLDYRDWASYVYVPILVPMIVLLPYFAYKFYQRSHKVNQIVESLAQGSRDVEQMSRLLDGPVAPFTGDRAQELPPDAEIDATGFLILQDLRMIDLRQWKPGAGDAGAYLYGYRRVKFLKEPDNTTNNEFRLSVLAVTPETQVRFPPQQFAPKLYSRTQTPGGSTGERQVHWEVGVDTRKVPPGETADVIYEHMSPGKFVREGNGSATLTFDVEIETVELTRWLLLPEGREYQSFQLIRFPTRRPEASENVKVITQFVAQDNTILAFKLLALKAGYTYEITWFYR